MTPLRLSGPVLLLVVASFGAAAQPPADHFRERLRVLEVQVPVEVIDRDGKSVRGLTREHFQVLDNGSPREIVDFQVVDRGREGSVRLTDIPLAGAARRHILLLFDLTFSDPLSISQARRAARELVLTSLHETDLVAVAVNSVEHGPTLLVTFTPDRAQVARAIDGLSFERGVERASLDPLRFLLEPPPTQAPEVSAVGRTGRGAEVREELEAILIESQSIVARQAERQETEYDRTRILTWSRDLERFAAALASVPGRKHVVLLSEGFDSRLLMGRLDLGSADAQAEQERTLSGQIWDVDTTTRFGDAALRAEAARLVEELRRADCVVQAVDIGGLRSGGDIRSVSQSAGEDTLFFFANETGGELFKNANDLAAQMEEALSRSAVTYVLSFQARGVEADGSFRRLRVKVDGLPRGVRVSHRSGYYAPRPFPEMASLERELLAANAIASAAPRDDLSIDLLAAPFRAGETHAYVPVILEVDGDGLFPDREEESVELELYAYASNDRGEMVGFFTRGVTLQGNPEVSRTEGFKYYGHLELRPGAHLIRVLVRELGSGRTGVATQLVRVPDFSRQEPVLLPPFFFDTPERWVLAREEAGGDGGTVVYPFIVDGEPYIPQAMANVAADSVARFSIVGYSLPANPKVITRVLSPDGELVAEDAVSLTRSASGIEELTRWSGTLRTSGLTPGRYRLQVLLDESAGDRRWTSEVPFRVAG